MQPYARKSIFYLPFTIICSNILLVIAPVAQWIERRPPEPGAEVRFLSGAFLNMQMAGLSVLLPTNIYKEKYHEFLSLYQRKKYLR